MGSGSRFMGYRGSCPAPRSELEARVGQGNPGRVNYGCGSDSLCSPPPTWPPPCQPLRGSGAASCGWGPGYRRPRPGQLSSAAPPRHLAQGVMAPLRVERAPGGSQLAVSTSPESLNQSHPTEDSLLSKGKMEDYETNVLPCWYYYKTSMDSVKDWCNWTLISRYYSNLRYCLEYEADKFGLGFPNPLAESIILEAHLIHFANCSLVQPTFSDPPEDVLLAMIIAPICLIPFLVTLVVWRSKDGDAQA